MNINTSPRGGPERPRVALIAGPTASGKSALALALAERADGVIINADSAQVYRDLNTLSARPGREDESRAPHRLYGYRDGAEPCSAAAWAEDAKAEIGAAHDSGKLPILAGGTGLYLRTLLDGIAPIPEIDPEVRARVRALPVAQSFAALASEDPAAAERIRPNDAVRIARALEVVRATGRPIAVWHEERTGGISENIDLAPLILLPPRDWLYERCDRRFENMFQEQGIEEVSSLLKRELHPLVPVMRAIGVPEIAGYLAGKLSREQALEAGRTATRRYAKRQYTWFSRQPPADWPRREKPVDCEPLNDALAAFAFGET
ncbi:tRNA (adenosine(37)-N6)-dimethylallyltransferase MiaA [Sphingosinicella rhizophila]|uniref:tRNA dimethylallyltransferase n=1 Tax=Sphingosinicella rhizophila TaxID=3050082 RepID=A0ABU3Q4C9_9SPHN|nr:tRNA (adenosine(37)-N6)-dimethylallyltransferase MiaA [Sphingosinicella sp. GR2756]MDT9597808.1 tRNA (adenosine(37)-N6)-dimethylallyltransferase MiaA [Sphingosinicella sp. GR2756]